MKVILHYIKPFIPRMSVGISIKFIGAVMELLLPWIFGLGDEHRGQPHGRLGGPAHHPGLAPRPL